MLFDMLLANDAEPLSLALSLQTDLHRLLNTKKGSLKHIPDYGIPDLHTVYQTLPKGKIHFFNELKKTILKFEPRIKSVDILDLPAPNPIGVLHVQMRFVLAQSVSINFSSVFCRTGNVKITDSL